MSDIGGLSERAVERLVSLARLLGYERCDTFFQAGTGVRGYGALLEQAFSSIGVWGVLALKVSPTSDLLRPIVYLAAAGDDAAAREIHRRVWSQSVAPVLMIVRDDSIEVRNGFSAPNQEGSRWDVGFAHDELPDELAKFHLAKIVSSAFWKDFDVGTRGAVDARLVGSIRRLNEALGRRHQILKGRADLINRMIGKLLYLYVLIDRRVVTVEWMKERLQNGGFAGSDFATEVSVRRDITPVKLWSGTELWVVMDAIDEAINGKLFHIDPRDRAQIPDEAWHLIHSVVRCASSLDGNAEQLAFFDVAFEILRTETISAIYEQFLAADEQVNQGDEGAFYTPPFLAEFALDQISKALPITVRSSIVDPAAGSGIFAVQAFRMLMEKARPPEGWSAANLHIGRDLLRNCIFAIDRNSQAIEVCRFSLCLTLLDYAAGTDIERLALSSGSDKFLPDLSDNVKVADAIGTTPFGSRRFTHVIGNPPWTHSDGSKSRKNIAKRGVEAEAIALSDAEFKQQGLPLTHKRMSDRFVWAAKLRYLEPGGGLGFLLPTRSLVGRHSGRFAGAVAVQFQLGLICNLSHLRYRLFSGARAPACLVVARNDEFVSMRPVRVQRPQLTSMPIRNAKDWPKLWSLFVSESDEEVFRSNDFRDGENGWFAPLMLGSEDRLFHVAFRKWSERERTIAHFLNRSGLRVTRGADQSMTGIPDLIIGRTSAGTPKAANIRTLTKKELGSAKGHFAKLFAGNVLLIPRTAKGYEYIEVPTAFKSTYNAIYDVKDRPPAERELVAKGLKGLKRYLETDLATYFVALFGAHYLMDKQRFEIGDFNVLPIPYDDILDPRLRMLEDKDDASALVLEHIGASPRLRQVVMEFNLFNKDYADGQIPQTAFELHAKDDEQEYVSALKSILTSSLPKDIDVTVVVRPMEGEKSLVRIGFGGGADDAPVLEPTQFVSKSVFADFSSPQGGCLVKSGAKFAWTRAQAAEDARVLLAKLVA